MVRNGRILVLQRSGGMSDGFWVPPAGLWRRMKMRSMQRCVRRSKRLASSLPVRGSCGPGTGTQPGWKSITSLACRGAHRPITAEHYDFDWLTPHDYAERHLRAITS